jgi:hypothetical protein
LDKRGAATGAPRHQRLGAVLSVGNPDKGFFQAVVSS